MFGGKNWPSTAIGGVGAALVLSHVMLGEGVVAPKFAVLGFTLLVLAGIYFVVLRRRASSFGQRADRFDQPK